MKSPVIRVSDDRWRTAQNEEMKTWRRQNSWYRRALDLPLLWLHVRKVPVGDDWNQWWSEKFEHYRVLPSHFHNAIELGCGPYTNMRVIVGGRTIDHVTCSDPLALHYVRETHGWLAKQHRSGRILVDDHPIEDCPFRTAYYDLVIMINVLDHVADAEVCLDTGVELVRPGGYLVVGQDLSNTDDAERTEQDVGHPIRIHHDDIDQRIHGFRTLYRIVLSREQGRNPNAHYGTLLYIGRKE